MSLGNVIRSEWIKLKSVRSTWWTVFGAYVITVGLGAIALAAIKSSKTDTVIVDYYPIDVALFGLILGQLAIAVTGVLVMSAEYSSGGIRTTLTAVPNRLRLFAAKAIVLGVFSFVVGAAISLSGLLLTQVFFGNVPGAGIGDHGVLRATLGGALYLTATALLALGIGGIIRNTGGGITTTVAALFVVPLMLYAIPGWFGDHGANYVTSNAGQQIAHIDRNDGLSPGTGYLVFLVWVAIALAGAAVSLRRRDA